MSGAMNMPVMYEVNGYDRASGELVKTYDVPAHRISFVLRTARVPASDGYGSYPLTPGQLAEIGALLETEIEPDNLDFFLEPYAMLGGFG